MALTTTEILFDMKTDDRPNLPPPPAVATTPCDPWPRPYYLENGLRRVAPYHFTYNTYCKQRWRDREILDIFAEEFRDRSKEYYKEAIEGGRIVLNGKPCNDVHTRVRNGDVISHTLHRHEPPVSAQPIRVVNETDEMIVIDKPAGIPVHPAGRYRYNSVVEIMRAERHYAFNPLPCNRLDRLTSGVMFVGKTGKEAEAISAKLRGRTVRKEYVARVKGRFPDGEKDQYAEGGPNGKGGVVKCEEPILQISPILGLNRARASGKSAKTLFRRIAYYPPKTGSKADDKTGKPDTSSVIAKPLTGAEDDGYSIVHCLPLTGRTHQIRVHLQFLGHPISNDPIYSNRRVFGASLAKGDSSDTHDADIKEKLGKMGKSEVADAYSYSNAEKQAKTDGIDEKPPVPKAESIDQDLSNLNITQTQQITSTELQLLRAQELHEKYGPTADYKPLHHGTLHAATLSPAINPNPTTSPSANPSSQNDSNPVAEDPAYASLLLQHSEMVLDYNTRKGEKLTGQICEICQTPLYSDPGPHELGIYLHALAYADLNGEWRFESPMPGWTASSEHGEMETPRWDYEALGEEASFDVEKEREIGREKNRKGDVKNRELELGEGVD